MNPRLRSIATASPAFEVRQQDAQALAAHLFPRFAESRRHMEVFQNARIETRQVAKPLEWFAQDHTFPEKNQAAAEAALELAVQAGREAIEKANLQPTDIDALVFVNTTAISTPSLDSKVIQQLGMSLHTVRLPVWGLGCAGGAAGLARAADLVRAGQKHVLLIAVEVCSMTFIRQDHSKSNFVGAALFADGAAAVVVSQQADGPEILGGYSSLIADSEDVMGWEVLEAGLKVRFSRDIPTLMHEVMPGSLQGACAAHGLQLSDLQHHVLHPGGVKVIEAYSQVAGVPMPRLQATCEVLRKHGNMSSPSVLFVLQRYLEQNPQPGKGILTAMGPGFCAEHVLFQLS